MATSLPEQFHSWLSSSIDEEGVSIPHALMISDGGDLTVFALALPPPEAYPLMLAQLSLKQPKELIFAFDRFTRLGQGTTLGDLVAGHHFVRGEQFSRPFIVEYQHDPRIVKPIEWGNPYWNAALIRELANALAKALP